MDFGDMGIEFFVFVVMWIYLLCLQQRTFIFHSSLFSKLCRKYVSLSETQHYFEDKSPKLETHKIYFREIQDVFSA